MNRFSVSGTFQRHVVFKASTPAIPDWAEVTILVDDFCPEHGGKRQVPVSVQIGHQMWAQILRVGESFTDRMIIEMEGHYMWGVRDAKSGSPGTLLACDRFRVVSPANVVKKFTDQMETYDIERAYAPLQLQNLTTTLSRRNGELNDEVNKRRAAESALAKTADALTQANKDLKEAQDALKYERLINGAVAPGS